MVSGWFADKESGCKVWVDEPMPLSSVKWDGACAGGVLGGNGRIYYYDGALNSAQYKGTFVSGKMHGYGKFVFDPAWNSVGQLAYSVYSGNWLDGKKSGNGQLVLPNGDVYDGNWLDGKMHGKGRLESRMRTKIQIGNFANGEYIDEAFIPSPLQLAILRQRPADVQEIVSRGANLAEKDNQGRDILTVAAESNFYIADFSRTMDRNSDIYKIYDRMVTRLIMEHVNESPGSKGVETQAQMVSRSKGKVLTIEQQRILEILVEGGAKISVVSQKFKQFFAINLFGRNYTLVNKLLSSGVDVDTEIGGKRLIEYAIEYKNIDFLKSLISKHASLNFPTGNNSNLVFYAVAAGDANIARYLVKSGAKFPDIYSGASAALKSWNFSEYLEWLNRGNVLGVLNSKQVNQLEVSRVKENGLYLAEQARLAEQAKIAERARIAEQSRQSASTSSAGAPVDYVMVDAGMVCGFCTVILRKLTLSGGPGNWSPSASSGAIHKGYNGALAGRYNYYAEFSENHSCSGTVSVSGMKRWLKISVYSDCRDAGTWEN